MKKLLVYFCAIWLLTISSYAHSEEIYVKQNERSLLITNQTVCFGFDFASGGRDVIAEPRWETVQDTALKHGWKKIDPVLCEFDWTVKYNTYNKIDGSRPTKNILTGKYTGKYLLPDAPCGERASLTLKEYYRVAPNDPASMVICKQ